jgi:hypothetical protein
VVDSYLIIKQLTKEKTMITTRKYICSKEKYLEFKARQIDITKSRKIGNQEYKKYIKARRQFYHSKGMTIPNRWEFTANGYVDKDKLYGFHYEQRQDFSQYDEVQARYHNIIYGIIKGKSYKQIENKVRDGNGVDIYKLEKYCKMYGVDYAQIRNVVWQTV